MEAPPGTLARPAVIRFVLPLIVAISVFTCGCEEHQGGGSATVKMNIGSRTFVLELARTPEEQEKGLMQRDSMPADHGMVFVFPEEQVLNFWMKNTRFPLDIIFVDSRGKIVSIKQMKAYDLTNTSSDVPARYAIELNVNAAAQAGARPGQVLEIPPSARGSGGGATTTPSR